MHKRTILKLLQILTPLDPASDGWKHCNICFRHNSNQIKLSFPSNGLHYFLLKEVVSTIYN